MKLELSPTDLLSLLSKQIDNLFVFDRTKETECLSSAVETALLQCEYCFIRTKNKYYKKDGETYFNPFHSGQYSIFLYFVSHALFNAGSNPTLADRVYFLNKCLNGLDLFYEVRMPKVFFLDHPVGSVLGRATYGKGFYFSQNCTVGNNKSKYPTLGQNVKMMSGSKILGDCQIGDHVIFSANTYVKDYNVPSFSLVFGSSPNLIIKQMPESYFAIA